MTYHGVEDYYKKCQVLHEKAIELHRERFRTSGSYDKARCQFIVDEIKYFAQLISKSKIDLDKEFGTK